ncbi:transcriptional regulator PtxR [Xenorhabdus mauleonii]|uniref:Transcriptional regulator PtxR n=1 Tax=Xenorhabdus mauleonii TaxID=351675 RepID=A0A1I3N5S3_9GAMM|nr:LysR family transcriptional regulator [Xenorhabdus mauleonii]PHM45777.1 transcriptional regulator PtxR [Xenorhabdus mauleonii]SFJ04445.1 transcriptional regulator, LysR family [Xenorhabdus mauleonii]
MKLLNDMELFVEVIKVNGFRRASDALGIPSSTISRRISALEKNIGLRLLHRTTRRLELTEAGQIYYERCRRIVEEARLAHEELGELLSQPSGVLRASMPGDFASTYLPPLITEFMHRYPKLSFDFDLTPHKIDLIADHFDVAIRIGEPKESNLVARKLANLRCGIYAAPSFIDDTTLPREPIDLSNLKCLLLRGERKLTWTLCQGATTVEVSVSGRIQLNSIDLMRRLAILGQGIAMLPIEIAAEDVEQGRLIHILPNWEGLSVPVYAITETRLIPAKTRLFIDFLQEKLTNVNTLAFI